MTFTAKQIATLLKGVIEGDPEAYAGSFGRIEEAESGQLALLANPKYEEYLYTTKASVIIVSEKLELKQPVHATLIRVSDPYSSFASLLHYYQELKTQQLNGVQEPSYISPTAKKGK